MKHPSVALLNRLKERLEKIDETLNPIKKEPKDLNLNKIEQKRIFISHPYF